MSLRMLVELIISQLEHIKKGSNAVISCVSHMNSLLEDRKKLLEETAMMDLLDQKKPIMVAIY